MDTTYTGPMTKDEYAQHFRAMKEATIDHDPGIHSDFDICVTSNDWHYYVVWFQEQVVKEDYRLTEGDILSAVAEALNPMVRLKISTNVLE